jgi:hypothetical protein
MFWAIFSQTNQVTLVPTKSLCQPATRVARFFWVPTYQNEKYVPNVYKLYQTSINYTNILHSKALQNISKFGFLF